MSRPSRARSDRSLRVFVSYARRDMVVADAIVAALEAHGLEVTIDRRDLPYGQKWQAELADFIRAADTVIWLVSPASVISKWCNWELGEVTRLNKRLIPVTIAPVAHDQLPEAIGEVHLLPSEGVFEPRAHFALLVAAIERDGPWLKEHTRLGDHARRWLAKSKDSALLLRGGALADAEAWADRQPGNAPPPTDEILGLVLTSRRAAARRQRLSVAVAFAIALFAGALGVFAELNRREASTQRDLAQVREQEAATQRDRALATGSQFVAELADQKARAGDVELAVLLALEALPQPGLPRPYVADAERSLYGAIHSRRLILDARGHAGDVNSAAFSRDGRRILTASADTTAGLWDADTGARIATLQHAGPVRRAEFSAAGTHAIAATDDGVVSIWDAASNRLVARPATDPAALIGRHPLASDTRHVAFGTHTGKLTLVELATGRVVASTKAHKDAVTGVAISADGRRIATASQDGTAAVWDVATLATAAAPAFRVTDKDRRGFVLMALNADASRALGVTGSVTDWRRSDLNRAQLWDAGGKLVAELKGHEFRILYATFSPNGQTIATLAEDGTTRLWSAATGQQLSVLGTSGEFAAFSRDGTRLLILSFDTIRVYLVASGKEIASAKLHAAGSLVGSAAFDPTARRVLTAHGPSAKVWDMSSRLALTMPKDFEAPEGDHESTTVAAGGRGLLFSKGYATKNDPTPPTELWDGRTGTLVTRFEVEPSFSTTTLFSPDGQLVAAACGTCEKPWLKLFRADDGRALATLSTEEEVEEVAFSVDGKLLLARKGDAGFIYDVAQRKQLTAIAGHKGGLANGEFGAGNQQLLTTGRDQVARIWDVRAGRQLRSLGDAGRPVAFATFGPPGAPVAAASGQSVLLWDVEPGVSVRTLEGHKGRVGAVRYSADGARLVSAADDQTAIVWDARSGQPLARLEGHSRGSIDARFSPDGLRIMTNASDTTTRLWDSATGANIAILAFVEVGGLVTGQFSHDGRSVQMASADHTSLALPIFPSTQALVDHARATVPVCLTVSDRKKYNLAPEPPRWCITGVASGPEGPAANWRPKHPYEGPKWRDWLLARDRGETPPFPDG